MRSSSPWDIFLGSQMTPPLAPPKGMLTTAHFQVIQEASNRVLDAVASEDFDGAVVHADGDVDNDFARGVAEDFPDALIEVEFCGGEVEPSGLGFPGICLLLEC